MCWTNFRSIDTFNFHRPALHQLENACLSSRLENVLTMFVSVAPSSVMQPNRITRTILYLTWLSGSAGWTHRLIFPEAKNHVTYRRISFFGGLLYALFIAVLSLYPFVYFSTCKKTLVSLMSALLADKIHFKWKKFGINLRLLQKQIRLPRTGCPKKMCHPFRRKQR